MALAAGLCGIGQGKAVASAAEALARNPGAGAKIQTLMILGLAFIESLALVTFIVVDVSDAVDMVRNVGGGGRRGLR